MGQKVRQFHWKNNTEEEALSAAVFGWNDVLNEFFEVTGKYQLVNELYKKKKLSLSFWSNLEFWLIMMESRQSGTKLSFPLLFSTGRPSCLLSTLLPALFLEQWQAFRVPTTLPWEMFELYECLSQVPEIYLCGAKSLTVPILIGLVFFW